MTQILFVTTDRRTTHPSCPLKVQSPKPSHRGQSRFGPTSSTSMMISSTRQSSRVHARATGTSSSICGSPTAIPARTPRRQPWLPPLVPSVFNSCPSHETIPLMISIDTPSPTPDRSTRCPSPGSTPPRIVRRIESIQGTSQPVRPSLESFVQGRRFPHPPGNAQRRLESQERSTRHEPV